MQSKVLFLKQEPDDNKFFIKHSTEIWRAIDHLQNMFPTFDITVDVWRNIEGGDLHVVVEVQIKDEDYHKDMVEKVYSFTPDVTLSVMISMDIIEH